MGLNKFPKMKFVPDREAYLVNVCRNKVVLHLGCADALHFDGHLRTGRHLHVLISAVAREAYGVDLDQRAIEKLRDQYGLCNLYVRNIEHLHEKFDLEFDVILAGEVIEHLSNPGRFLESVGHYMSHKTLLILTTPNLFGLKMFLHSIVGNQRIHPDHSLGFTFSLLENILSRHNYTIVEWLTTVERFSSKRNWLANLAFHGFFSLLPYYADALIVVAKRQDEGSHG